MSSPESSGAKEDKPLALQSKEKSGKNRNLGATEVPPKRLLSASIRVCIDVGLVLR
jgi:hypothetical protein